LSPESATLSETPRKFKLIAVGEALEFLDETYPANTRGMGYCTVKIA